MSTYLQPAGSGEDDLLGPFRGLIALGSDGSRCQLVVGKARDIRPVHATLGPLKGGQHTLAPAGPDCRVYLRMPDGEDLWEVDSPISAKVGATIYLGSPKGPAFVIQRSRAGDHDPPLSRVESQEMMGALDRALGGQVRAMGPVSAPNAPPSSPRGHPAPPRPTRMEDIEIPADVLRQVVRPRRSPFVVGAVAWLSGVVVGTLAFGAATFAVLQALGTSG